MKKLFFALLALAVLAGCAAAAEEEATFRSGDFEYALLENGDAELIRYLGEDGRVIIPNKLDGHPITAVRGNPFVAYDKYGHLSGVRDCSVSVALDHPYLATIDGVLFGITDRKLIYYQPSLKTGNYEIPYGITAIGDYAFYRCSGLTSITIPDCVTAIGVGAFEACSNLANVTIPNSVTAIGDYAFHGCSGLANVTIPDSVTAVGNGAFYGCSGLTSVTIPNSVTIIGDRAFLDCSRLRSVTIPDSVTVIGEGAFYGCSGLTSVTIPDSVTSIGNHAFDDYVSEKYNLVFTVTPGSYAETWCRENGRQFVHTGVEYGDRTDWLPGR